MGFAEFGGGAVKAPIDPRMTRARSALVMSQPFWGTLALYLDVQEDASVETMATDGTRLLYAPAFLDTLSETEAEGVIAHEVSHCAYKHHTRRGDRDATTWNEAADYAINRDLIAAGFTLPKCALMDARFDAMSAEEIYSVLQKKKEDEKKKGNSGGSGDQKADPGRCGQILDAAPDKSPGAMAEAEAEWEVRVRQAVNVATKVAGTLPGHLQGLVSHALRANVDWREVLRRFIDDKSRCDYSWSSPNKRMLGMGYVFPGIVADGMAHLVIIVDTSGSIDDQALARFSGELQAAMDDGAASRVTVVHCDAKVQHVEEFQQGDEFKLEPRGGGGTRFAPAFEWVAENVPDATAIIYFTDLDATDHGEEPAATVMWAAYGNANDIRRRTPPFGEVIHVL